jgi:hypothetical protein
MPIGVFMYERKIDLMDALVSPRSVYNHRAREEGAKIPQSNREIVDFVVREMSGTLAEEKAYV